MEKFVESDFREAHGLVKLIENEEWIFFVPTWEAAIFCNSENLCGIKAVWCVGNPQSNKDYIYHCEEKGEKLVVAVSKSEKNPEKGMLALGETICAENSKGDCQNFIEGLGIVQFVQRFSISPYLLYYYIGFNEEHTIYMMVDCENLLWENGTAIAIGEDHISLGWLCDYEEGDFWELPYIYYLELNIPNLKKWYESFPLFDFWVSEEKQGEYIKNFDYVKWENQGMELAKQVVKKLPEKWHLIYVPPYEDQVSGFPEETEVFR